MARNTIFDNVIRDKEYARKVVPLLTDGQVVKSTPLSVVSRCHICGDSKRHKNKKRLGIYETPDNSIHVHCFKCGYSSGLSFYLKEYWPTLYSQYLFDVFKEHGINKKTSYKEPEPIVDTRINYKNINEKLVEYIPLTELPEQHPIFRYIKHRQIPKNMWHRLGFTRHWKTLCNEVRPDTFPDIYNEHPRLVIPSFDKRGILKTINGRAFSDDQLRYQIVKVNDSVTKFFGEESVNLNKPIINVVEGPLDSLFVDNSIALAGATLDLKTFDYPKSSRVFILDNEPRHTDTIKRIQNYIKHGEQIVLWDKLPANYKNCKDINDMIMKGMTVESLNQYLKDNIVTGLTAQLRFDQWRKK